MDSTIQFRIPVSALLSGAMLFAAPSMLSANDLAIVNPSFEDGVMDEDNFLGTTSDWRTGRYDVSNPGVWIDLDEDGTIYRPTTNEYTDPGVVPDGEKVAYVEGFLGIENGIRQILASQLEPNLVYTLSVAIGNPALYNDPPPAPDYRIELLAGGVLLASTSGSPPADDSEFAIATVSYASGPAPDQVGQALEIRLITLEDVRNDFYEVDFDDVRLTADTLTAEFALRITSNGADFDFEWESRPGKVYDLLSRTDLDAPIADWVPYNVGETVYEDIPATGGTMTLPAVPSAAPKRFFALREKPAPAMAFDDLGDAKDGSSTGETIEDD